VWGGGDEVGGIDQCILDYSRHIIDTRAGPSDEKKRGSGVHNEVISHSILCVDRAGWISTASKGFFLYRIISFCSADPFLPSPNPS